MGRRVRLDSEIVRRKLASSRQEAQQLIHVHRVVVNGSIALKSAHQVDPGDAIEVVGPPRRFVSRGGEKLEGALEVFGIDVAGRYGLDVGASTGGFTDCLLQRGATSVVALDVGHGQLDPRIRNDERVVVFERVNIRTVEEAEIGGPFDVVVADLSFISLTTVMQSLLSRVTDSGDLIMLVKPQFEVGRRAASVGKGIITDPVLHEEACRSVSEACERLGGRVLGVIPSPILGGQGNQEFLLHAVVRERLPG